MYEDVHRYFLQFMLKHSCTTLKDALAFCNLHTDMLETLSNFKTFLADINTKIDKQHLKIVLLKCEVTGDMKVTLINTANDHISKLQNAFSAVEVQYFQVVLKELLVSEEHRLPFMHCLNLSSNVPSVIRKDNAEKVLEQWIRGGYLVDQDSYVYLGPRCIAEFAPYFSTHCKDLYSSCNLCSEPVFTGQTCHSCQKIMHKHCIEKYLEKQTTCPNCKKAWNAEVTGSQSQVNSNSSSEDENTTRTSKRRKTSRRI